MASDTAIRAFYCSYPTSCFATRFWKNGFCLSPCVANAIKYDDTNDF